jgi:hypothetical protein
VTSADRTGASPDGEPDWQALLQRAEDLARRSAEVADAVASNFEGLAATYRRMAEAKRQPSTTSRLLEHVDRLEGQAVQERAAAVRYRNMVDRSFLIS